MCPTLSRTLVGSYLTGKKKDILQSNVIVLLLSLGYNDSTTTSEEKISFWRLTISPRYVSLKLSQTTDYYGGLWTSKRIGTHYNIVHIAGKDNAGANLLSRSSK